MIHRVFSSPDIPSFIFPDTTRRLHKMGDLGDSVVTVEKPWDQGKVEQQKHWIMGNDTFNAKAVHHQGIKELWEKKWKFPVRSSKRMKRT